MKKDLPDKLPFKKFEGNTFEFIFDDGEDRIYHTGYPGPELRHTASGPIYYCKHCDEDVKGWPTVRFIDDIGVLVGRRGYDWRCVRCEKTILFHGIMA